MDIIRKKYYSMLVGGVLSCLVVAIVVMSDTIVAGVLLGYKAVSGMSLVLPAYSFTSSVALFFSIGAPILYSKANGKFDKDRADRVFQTGLTFSVGSGIILSVLLLIFGDYYLSLFDVEPEILKNARTYMFWIGIDTIFIPASIFLPGMLLADGDETLSTASDVVSSISNIVFSVILGKMMGVAGIGIGSVIGSVLGLLICSLHFMKKRNSLKPRISFSFKIFIDIVKYGAVDASGTFFISLFIAMLNKYLTSHFGPDMLIISSVIAFATEWQLLMDGVGDALVPSMSMYLMTGLKEGVNKMWREAKKSAFLIGIALTLLIEIFAPIVPGILGITDSKIVHIATIGIRIMAINMPAVSYLFLLTSYNLMIKRIVFGVVVNGLYEFVLAAISVLILGNTVGIYGVFASVVIAPYLTWFSIKCYVELKEGKAAWPLRFYNANDQSMMFDFSAEPETIIETQTELEEKLKQFNVPKATITKCSFVFEELFMLIYDKNKPKVVNSEFLVIIKGDTIELLEIDDGIIFSLVDEVADSKSFREYVLSQLIIEWSSKSKYMRAISFNRNRIEIKMTKTE